MTEYRISKYNPEKRDNEGNYLDNSEWTAISDIGQCGHEAFTFEEYERIEKEYVNAILLILSEKSTDFLYVDSIGLCSPKVDFELFEKTGRIRKLAVDYETEIKPLKNGLELDLNNINKFVRLILRETIDLALINDKIRVNFGYDYYIFVECETLNKSTIKQIEDSGLFVESDIGCPTFEYFDENGDKID